MFVVVVTARGNGPGPHWSVAVGERVLAALRGHGIEVTWLRALPPGVLVPAPAGVEVIDFVAPVPGFHRVTARGDDVALDVALAKLLRHRPADSVIHLGLGAVGTVQTLWLADRMGSVPLAVVKAREVLCHRGDLQFAGGEACAVVDDPRRCGRCVTTPCGTGVSAWHSRWLHGTRWLPGSRFPGPEQFLNRLDLVVGSLQVARLIAVVDPPVPEALTDVGVPARAIVPMPRERDELGARLIAELAET
ncbi:MAG: hypothetical protein IPK26_23140 [Planctomycetes bacterium]|nr:hypothetical protein [Planctomycetota bacterium]